MKSKKKTRPLLHFFTDKEGTIVIGQFPNRSLLVAMVLYFLRFVNPQLLLVSTICTPFIMMYWAYLEITQGVNDWRKFLGVVVGVYFLYQLITNISTIALI